PAQLVLLAMGCTGPETGDAVEQLGLGLDGRGNIARDESYMAEAEGVFVAGDAGRGQSLIVWALAEGRACAAGVDACLSGATNLASPSPTTARPLAVCPVAGERIGWAHAKSEDGLHPGSRGGLGGADRAAGRGGHGRRPPQPQPRHRRGPRAG